MNKNDLARKYIDKFPNTAKKTIARKLKEDYPKLYKSVEDARWVVRFVSGQAGHQRRLRMINKDHLDDNAKKLLNIFDGFEAGDINDFEIYQIPKNIKRCGIFSDHHIPYHDADAILKTLVFFKKKEVDCIILNGDVMDCYMESRFVKDPTKRRFKGELDLVKDFLRRLRDAFPNVLIVYKEGNHEERHEALLKVKAPMWYDIEAFRLDELLGLRELEIPYVNKKRIIQSGKLNIIHGHEFGYSTYNPVNPARGFFTKAKENVVGGHHHRSSENPEPSMTGKLISAWSIGCMCDLHPEYLPINKWNLGFGVQTIVDEHGNYRFDNKKMLIEKDKDKSVYTIV